MQHILQLKESAILAVATAGLFMGLHSFDPVRLRFTGATVAPDFNAIMHAYAYSGSVVGRL
jgi:hypothetical protein